MAQSLTLESVLAQIEAKDRFTPFIEGYVEVCKKNPIPLLHDFMTGALAPHLRNVTIIEPGDDDQLFYRMAGTAIDVRMGRPMAGMNALDSLPQESRQSSLANARLMVELPCAQYSQYENQFESGCSLNLEMLSLPILSGPNNGHMYILSLHSPGASEREGFEKGDKHVVANFNFSAFVDTGHGVPEHEPLAEQDLIRRATV